MKHLSTILLLLVSLSYPLRAQTRIFTILDQQTKEAITGAHLLETDKVFEVSDNDGKARVPVNIVEFKVRALGFIDKIVNADEADEVIQMIPMIIRPGQDIIVYAYGEDRPNVREYGNRETHHTLDHFLNNIDGIAMIQRGAFAREPSIRGQSDQRMNLMIDGMQIFKACVDKMDPISSYVESNNLSKLKVDKGGSGVAENGNGNSTINLVSKKPEFSEFTLHAESGIRMPDIYRVYSASSNYAGENTAFYAAGSVRKADNYVAGKGVEIPNSQFNKMNLNVGVKQRIRGNHIMEVNYITDKATDVGYPALLMDATKALANILRLQYTNEVIRPDGFQLKSAMVYGNTVRHWMDDWKRDVSQREVMRNMHMPMYGSTKTVGSKLEGTGSVFSHNFDWFLNGFLSDANGHMLMQSLDPAIEDMFIYNMDRISTKSLSLGARHSLLLHQNLLLKLEESINLASVSTPSKNYQSLFEGLYGKEYRANAKVLLSGSANLVWLLNESKSISLSSIYSERQGSHIEMLGHYIYNYTDGYFYDGNPWLKPEKTLHFETNFTEERESVSFSVTLFHKLYFDYISGREMENLSNVDFHFKQYENMGRAMLSGGELRTLVSITKQLKTDHRASYTYGKNLTLNDPLPQIPPFKGSSSVLFSAGSHSLSGGVEWALTQNRISAKASTEEKTVGYAVFNFDYSRMFLKDALTAVLEVKNILDTRYREHTSIAGIPEAGRSMMFTLKYHL